MCWFIIVYSLNVFHTIFCVFVSFMTILEYQTSIHPTGLEEGGGGLGGYILAKFCVFFIPNLHSHQRVVRRILTINCGNCVLLITDYCGLYLLRLCSVAKELCSVAKKLCSVAKELCRTLVIAIVVFKSVNHVYFDRGS
jgi:hypothetical protein